MKFKNNTLTIFLIAVTLSLMLACKQSISNKRETQTICIKPNQLKLSIDTFSVFPPEIDGCSCYFSNDSAEFKKGEYIYVNDYAHISYIKINGVLTKFTQTDFEEVDSLNVKEKYKNDHYEMTIESKGGVRNSDETWLKTGTIKLTNKKGETVTVTFYGECGC